MNAIDENSSVPATRQSLLSGLAEHLAGVATPLEQIDQRHRPAGSRLAEWIAASYRPGRALPVVVVCTGNSRRSMLGALMGNAAAAFHGLPEVRFFSAGTAPSVFNPRAIATLKAVGFEIEPTGDEVPRGSPELPNPRQRVRWGTAEGQELIEFSKSLGDSALPRSGFAAIMVCDEADAGCPFVLGSALRLSMPFPDPKASDGTAEEQGRYAATRDALGRLMMAVFGEARLRPGEHSPH